jgi:hypothetical protein
MIISRRADNLLHFVNLLAQKALIAKCHRKRKVLISIRYFDFVEDILGFELSLLEMPFVVGETFVLSYEIILFFLPVVWLGHCF